MKTVKNFLTDFFFCQLISVPCFFLCDMIVEKNVIDWLDIELGLAGASVLLLIAYMLFARCCKESKGRKIVGTMTILAIVATVIYSVFMLLEWLSPDNAESGFTGNWVQWFPVSISLSVFLYMQERRRRQSYKKDNGLFVVAKCQDKEEAEVICTKLAEQGIKALVADKKNPMYIENDGSAGVQVQVMESDLARAKELIR